jgi:hypothetical protein
LYLFLKLATEAGLRDVTFQTIARLLGDNFPLLWLLAQAHESVEWKRGAVLDMTYAGDSGLHERYLGLTQSLLPSVQRRSPRPLGEALRQHLDGCTGLERILALRFLARRLQGRIAPLAATAAGSPMINAEQPLTSSGVISRPAKSFNRAGIRCAACSRHATAFGAAML